MSKRSSRNKRRQAKRASQTRKVQQAKRAPAPAPAAAAAPVASTDWIAIWERIAKVCLAVGTTASLVKIVIEWSLGGGN